MHLDILSIETIHFCMSFPPFQNHHCYCQKNLCFGIHQNQTDIFTTMCILNFDSFYSRLSLLPLFT